MKLLRAMAAAALCLLAPALPAAAQDGGQVNPFSPALVVNDLVITFFDLDQRGRFLLALGATPQQAQAIARETLITDRLKFQEAQRSGVTLSDEELEAGIAQFARVRGATPAQLEGALGARGVSRSALEEFISAELLWRKAMRLRFGARATPTDQDVESAIELGANAEAVSVRLAEIAIPYGPDGREDAIALAERLSIELNAGGDFEAAAREHSRSASRRQGGEIGVVPFDALPPEIASEIALLDEGGVTAAIALEQGVTVLKLLERIVERADGPETVLVTYGRATVPVPGAAAAAERQRLREEAQALAAELTACREVIARQDELGPGAGITGPVAEDEIPAEIRAVLAPLVPGQTSTPVERADGFDVFILCQRDVAVGDEAREGLRDQIFQSRMASFAEGYLQELQRDAVIETR
ncbi:MAG: peptidylprolyl isomerase [Pseudomonadota bacterium]